MTLPEIDTIERRMLNAFVDAADAGQRAPTRFELSGLIQGDPSRTLANLVSKGVVESRVYGRNWRVIFIKKGMHKGKCTKEPPHGWQEHRDSQRLRHAL